MQFLLLSLLPLITAAPSTCGNGQLDAGEQCDPTAPQFSPECCSQNCLINPSTVSCGSGSLGVCNAFGKCTTRSSICSDYNPTLIQFQSPVAFLQNITSIQGPFSLCSGSSSSSNSGSILSQLPVQIQQEASCKISCEGLGSNQQRMCIDFNQFLNLPASAPDNLGCLLTDSQPASQLSASNLTVDSIGAHLQPGVCMTGVCRPDLCSRLRCGGNGKCIIGSDVLHSVRSLFKLEAYSAPSIPSTVQCQCQNGFYGDQCQFTGNQTTNNNNTNTMDANGNGNISPQQYQQGIFIAVFATFICMLLLFLIALVIHKKRQQPKKDDLEAKQFQKPIPEPPLDRMQLSPIDSAATSAKQSLPPPPPPQPTPTKTDSDHIYSSSASSLLQKPAEVTVQQAVIKESQYLRASHTYTPRLTDEIQLLPGDILYLIKAYDDGWAKAYNLRSGKQGIFPLSFTKRILIQQQSEIQKKVERGQTMSIVEMESQVIEEEGEKMAEDSSDERQDSLKDEKI